MKDVWRVRLYFLILWGALGTITPFLNLFYNRQGIPARDIGFLVTVNALMSLVFSPILGMMSGRVKKPPRIVQFGLFSSGILMFLVGRVESVPVLLVLIGLNALVFAGVMPISISMAQAIAGRGTVRAGFGSMRLFGALGWALVTYAAGAAIEKFGIGMIFWGYLALTILGVGALQMIPCENEMVEGSRSRMFDGFSVVSEILKDRSLVGLGITIFVLFGALIGARQFEVLYLDELGATERLIGLAFTITALVEMPFMLLADRLVERLNSTNVLRLGLVLDLGRLVLVALFPSIPVIILGRVIGGIAYAFDIVALVQFVLERAPEGRNAALQAIYNVTLPYLVAVIIAPIVGEVFDIWGGYMMYIYGIAGTALAIGVFFTMVRGRRSKAWREVTE